ncbi:unnamed protein product [Cladocopium goreaui]|uniref:Protein kinase C and casein kinase substrate in neurons protein 2 (Focal adhesion protein of 52 kDa) (FAP52) n=1 Tax=Cladocopium goreaui TaxID=2562237 RepID=A0A9P1BKI7_9DINO|nr:unnamed protein product [Cladocopium goreaui]
MHLAESAGVQHAAPRSASEAASEAAETTTIAIAEAAQTEVDEPDEPGEPLTFREHLWDRFDVIWGWRMGPTRRMLEGFVCCMRERAQLERQYARGLLHCVAKLQQTTSEGAVPLPLEAVVSNLRHRAEQCAVLAEELDQEVADTMERMLEQHAEVSRRMHSDGVCLMRHWQSASQGFEGAEEKYHQACSAAELEAVQCAALSPLKPTEWKQWAERTIRASRQAVSAEKDFHKVLKKFNTSVELQERQMAHVLDAAQDMEEKRAMCFQDAVMKIAVFDTSWLRNVQYDIDSGVQALEDCDGLQDLQAFMRRNRTKATFPSKHLSRPPWEMCATDPADGDAIRSESSGASELILRKSQELQPLVRSLLRRGSKPHEVDAAESNLPSQEEVSKLCDLLAGRASQPLGLEGVTSECLIRTAFCFAIRSELSSSEASVHSAEPPQAAELGEDAFEVAVSLFQAALDGADKDCDVWNGRELLVLAKFLQLEESRKDVLLRVYNHPLWSRVTFWEDLLLAGLAEAHFQLILSRWAAPSRLPESLSCLATSVDAASAKREVQEVVMTPFLQRYMAYMVSLGINFEQARGSAMRTLRKHVELLGTSHEAYLQLITHEADAMPLAK